MLVVISTPDPLALQPAMRQLWQVKDNLCAKAYLPYSKEGQAVLRDAVQKTGVIPFKSGPNKGLCPNLEFAADW